MDELEEAAGEDVAVNGAERVEVDGAGDFNFPVVFNLQKDDRPIFWACTAEVVEPATQSWTEAVRWNDTEVLEVPRPYDELLGLDKVGLVVQQLPRLDRKW